MNRANENIKRLLNEAGRVLMGTTPPGGSIIGGDEKHFGGLWALSDKRFHMLCYAYGKSPEDVCEKLLYSLRENLWEKTTSLL